jgi:oligopeptide transport system ATP-binding protein
MQVGEPVHLHRQAPWAVALEKARELLGWVRMSDTASRVSAYPHQFSGGMRQRAMIAMALACEPQLIIADEPTTALDVTVQAQILDLLKDLADRSGSALVLITHDLGVVARYADRVVVMYAGRVVESAPAADLYAHPRHPYTRGLMASVPSLDGDTHQRLVPIEGQPPDLANMHEGCAFAPRCQQATAACRQSAPDLREWDTGHQVACFLEV